MNEGPGQEPLAPETQAVLRAHVAAILTGAGVGPAVRDDLAEELHGHLVERLQSHLSRGMSEADAAARAIADFGAADRLARDFGRTYHSRLWASTIGVLLPAVVATGERPGVVGWLRFTIGITAVLTVGSLVFVGVAATPLRALGTTVADLIGLVALVLAYRALGSGQRWALWYAIAIDVELLISGIGSVVTPATAGSTTIPFGALLAIGVLYGVWASWARLQTFVAGSRAIGRGLALALTGSVLLPAFAGPVLAGLPDPTQAAAADLALRLSMTCDRGDVPFDSGPPAINVQRLTLVAEMTWRRTDLLPQGIAGLLPSEPQGDSAGFRLLDEPPGTILPSWLLASDGLQVVDVQTGQSAGWFGASAPSEALLPATIGSFTIGIEPSAIHAGHTIRASWLLTASSDSGATWPRIEVAYVHLDRFMLRGTVSCGETVLGTEAPVMTRIGQGQLPVFLP
jgi:hypothetical protein